MTPQLSDDRTGNLAVRVCPLRPWHHQLTKIHSTDNSNCRLLSTYYMAKASYALSHLIFISTLRGRYTHAVVSHLSLSANRSKRVRGLRAVGVLSRAASWYVTKESGFYLLPVQPWASDEAFLCLSFFFHYKIQILGP